MSIRRIIVGALALCLFMPTAQADVNGATFTTKNNAVLVKMNLTFTYSNPHPEIILQSDSGVVLTDGLGYVVKGNYLGGLYEYYFKIPKSAKYGSYELIIGSDYGGASKAYEQTNFYYTYKKKVK